MKKMYTAVFVAAVLMMTLAHVISPVSAAEPAPAMKLTATPVASPTPIMYALPYPGILRHTHYMYLNRFGTKSSSFL